MRRRIASTVIALSLTIGTSAAVLGADYNSSVVINNQSIKLEEIHKNEKEQLMFPVRTISEKLDYIVKWDNDDKSVKISKNEDIVKLKIGQTKINVNGKQIELKTSPMVKNGHTLISIEFLETALGLNLGWDSDKKVLKINNPTEKAEKYFEISEDEVVIKRIDKYMNTLNEYQNFQGSLLVAKDNKLLISKGYGLANVGQNINNQSQTKFAIGSITKQFTAMAIMQLAEKSLLNVDDKVSKYIPELKQGKNITIDNLLTHTSGLANYTSLPEFMQSDLTNKDPMTMVNLIKDKELEVTPGEIFQYSNTNYLLLGMIVEKITDMSLEDYLEKNILLPLDMKSTGVTYGKNNIAPDATPHTGFIEVQEINDKLILTQAYGSGNMYSTVEDLYRWDRALKTEKIVSKKTLDKIFKNHITMSEKDGYGYGWMIKDTEDGKYIGHGGNTFGFSAELDRYIDKDLTVIALSNKGYVDVAEITQDIKNITLKKPYENPEKLEEIKLKDKEVYKKYIGKYSFNDGVNINISETKGKLYAQVEGQPAFEIFPQTEDKFFAKTVDVKIEFTTEDEEEASQLTLEQLGQEFICERIDENAEPEEPLEAVDIDTKIYKDYVGQYELAPGVIVIVTNENDKLYAKLTGQAKYEIFPLSETEYFYKVVNAKISFERDANGKVIRLILDQNREKMPASKK